MEKLPKTVIVLDIKGIEMQPTDSGKARRLLKSGKAMIVSRQPFCIQLKRLPQKPCGVRQE